MRLTQLRSVALAVGVAVCLVAFYAWLDSRSQERQLRAMVAEEQKIIVSANKREADRGDSVKKVLAGIGKLKKKNKTPSQLLKQLPLYLPLPEPIGTGPETRPSPLAAPGTPSLIANFGLVKLRPESKRWSNSILADSKTAMTASGELQDAKRPDAAPAVQIPAPDLKPLFDYVQDCRACETELQAAVENATDNSTKLQALTRERDEALKAAKGGSVWKRFCREFGWFAAGVVGGVVAARI